MKGHLVHVEYPRVVMGAKKEQTSELHSLLHFIINILRHTCCLIRFHAIDVVMLLTHKAIDCFVTSFNALGAKGVWEQRQCLQADKTVSDADPLLASRKDPHEQLMLNRMKLPIESR
jgi:hypothetical protein